MKHSPLGRASTPRRGFSASKDAASRAVRGVRNAEHDVRDALDALGGTRQLAEVRAVLEGAQRVLEDARDRLDAYRRS